MSLLEFFVIMSGIAGVVHIGETWITHRARSKKAEKELERRLRALEEMVLSDHRLTSEIHGLIDLQDED